MSSLNVCGCAGSAYLDSKLGACEECPAGSVPSADFSDCVCSGNRKFVSGRGCVCDSSQFLDVSSGECVACGAGGRQDSSDQSRCTCGEAVWDAERNACPGVKSRALSPGAVVGIIIGILAAAALIGLCAFRMLRRDLLKRAAMADLFEMKHDQFVV